MLKIQKKQFKIGELCELLEIKHFVIRFWEKEFNIKPSRSNGGHRAYSEEHLNKFQTIKELLYIKKFTLEGAKKELKNYNKNIIPSHKTTLEKSNENNDKIKINDLERHILELKTQLIKLKELL